MDRFFADSACYRSLHLGSEMKKFMRKAVSVSQETLVSVENLQHENSLPLLVRPAVNGVNLTLWAKGNQGFIEELLLKVGAILFRGFGVKSADEFEEFAVAISGELLEYSERSSPRSHVSGNVYTSTDYPAEQSIFPHNELSYSVIWPMKLFFFCVVPAAQGGETPIADTRKIFERIDPAIRERFVVEKWTYVRNFGDKFGLPWQVAFQSTDKREVEEYCRAAGIGFEWKDSDRLRTRQVRPAIARHPQTGEIVWFNHATFFHVSTLEPNLSRTMLKEFKEEDLPNNTYYGNGSRIEQSVLDELRAAYQQELVTFPWQQGDILMLDNMLTAHSRLPFTGPRKVLFAMAEPNSDRGV